MPKIKFEIATVNILKIFLTILLGGAIMNCCAQKNDSNCLSRDIFKDTRYKADYVNTIISYYIDGSGNIEYFKNDTLELSWYSNGACRSERHYKYGQTSLVKSWWENGLNQCIYQTNELWIDRKVYGSGEYRVIYAAKEDGTLMVENGNGFFDLWGESGNYKDTVKTGLWTHEFNNGTIIKAIYKHGLLDGSYERLNKENQLIFKSKYQNGFPVGDWQSWYSNRRKHSEGIYKNGEILTLSFWNPEGKKMIENGKGQYYYYDDNGQPNPYSKIIEYIDGKEKQ